jgi:signal transduction histidine kinase/ABC-type phosphate/phosphonate transport system substrate-binding protein
MNRHGKKRHGEQVAVLLSSLLVVTASYGANEPQTGSIQEINIGVLAIRGADNAYARWQPTADYLSASISGYHFTIIPLTIDSIGQAVGANRVDFVLSNPASYATLEKTHGVTRLLTLKNSRLGGAYTQFGALIFTRADRADIKSLQDLKGKSFMAVHSNAFGGWWMALGTFKEQGIEPGQDFSRMEFSGFPQDKVVYAVKEGRIDAGTVRTDILERMQAEGKINIADFKVLNEQPRTAEFPFVRSTRLYPEWAFAKTRQASDVLAMRITIALLNLAPNHSILKAARIAGWTVPLDYQAVHNLMMELRVGPYVNLGTFKLSDVIRKYAAWIVAIGIGLLCMILFSVIVSRLNRQLSHSKQSLELSKAELEQEVMERKRAEEAEKFHAKRIRALYEITAIPGLSFDEQIEKTIKLGCKIFNLEIGKVCRIDPENDTNELIKVVAPEHYKVKSGIKLPLSNTLCSLTFNRNEPLAINEMGKSEYKDHVSYGFTGLESYIGTPIWVNNKKFGTINFSGMKPSTPFSESDKDLIKLIGQWASVAFERQHAMEETRKAREDAEIANRAKSAFLANMSHELRTPLNAVIGYSELLRDELEETGNTQLINDAININRSGKNLLALINGVLDLSKIEAGKIELDIETIKVTALIEEIKTTIIPLVHKNDNKFTFSMDDSVDTIQSDYIRLRQILLNLLGNACKFTEQGEIHMTVQSATIDDAEWLYFHISDTGKGIEPDEVGKLFQEFSQAGKTEDKIKGTGLGLAISHKFCRLLGGDIKVKSAVNAGSTFTVILPKTRAKSQENAA